MRLTIVTVLLFLLVGCKDIFTTSVLSGFKKDASDMSAAELSAYVSSTPLSDIPAEDLLLAEASLSDNRIELSESDLNNSALVEQYIEETKLLVSINMEQADVEGLIGDALNLEEGDEDFVDNLLEDTERLDNIEEASAYAVDAYKVDPDSLTSTELVVGGIGLLGDILEDDTKASALESIDPSDTTALKAADFTTEEIEDIQTASEMLTLAEAGLDDGMADLFEGLPI